MIKSFCSLIRGPSVRDQLTFSSQSNKWQEKRTNKTMETDLMDKKITDKDKTGKPKK